MKSHIILGFFLVPLICQIGRAETIGLDAYLDLVRERHPFFTKEAMQAEIEGSQRDRYLGSQDWVLTSTPAYGFRKPIVTGPFSPRELNSLRFEAGLGRAFWKTGGRLSVSWENSFLDQDLPDILVPGPSGDISIPIGPGEFYENRVSLAYSHPLLRNRGGALDRLPYRLSDFNVHFARVAALENEEEFLLDVGTRYLEWALAAEQRRIAAERLSLAEEELAQMIRKRKANLVERVDVLRAEDSVRIARQNIVLIEAQVKSIQAELAVLAQDERIYQMVPDFDLYVAVGVPDEESAVRNIRDRRVLEALRIRRDQVEKQKEGFKETALPELFLNIKGALQEGDDRFGRALELDKPDVEVSLEFRYPLGNRTAASDVLKTALQSRQLEAEIKSVMLELEANVRKLLVQIAEIERVLVLNREQIRSAKEKTGEELRLYNQGRGELTFVIQSRDNEELAELTYAQNAANYHKLVLTYRALVDDLLPLAPAGKN